MAERVKIRQRMTTSENIVTGEKIWVYTAYLKWAESDKHYHKKAIKGKDHLFSVKAGQLSLIEKINSFVESAEKLEGLHNWKNTTENNENKCLQ